MQSKPSAPEYASEEQSSAAGRIRALEAEIDALKHSLNDAMTLNRIIAAVASTLDATEAFALACTELARAFAVPQVALAVFNPARTALKVVAEHCDPGRVSGLGEEIPALDNPIMDYVLAHRAPLNIADARSDPRLPGPVRDLLLRRRTASLLIVPVFVRDEIVGTVGIDAIEPRLFRPDELALAQNASRAVSQALYNARLHEAVQHELAERKRAEAVIQSQAEALAALSTPLIPLTDRVLVLPLIGTVDAARAQNIMDTLLTGVSERRANTVIIDITGLPMIDTLVASVLTRTARAVQLLGATTIITGIRPEVAQTIVGLGVDLQGIITFGTLQSGIKFAVNRM